MAVIYMAKGFSQAILDQIAAKHGEPDEKKSVYQITGDGWGPEMFIGNRQEMEDMARANGDKRWHYATREYAYIWYDYSKERERDIDCLEYAIKGNGRMQEVSRQRAIDRGYKLDA